jgi:hypothetical protein
MALLRLIPQTGYSRAPSVAGTSDQGDAMEHGRGPGGFEFVEGDGTDGSRVCAAPAASPAAIFAHPSVLFPPHALTFDRVAATDPADGIQSRSVRGGHVGSRGRDGAWPRTRRLRFRRGRWDGRSAGVCRAGGITRSHLRPPIGPISSTRPHLRQRCCDWFRRRNTVALRPRGASC